MSEDEKITQEAIAKPPRHFRQSRTFLAIELSAIFAGVIGLLLTGIGLMQAAEDSEKTVISTAWENISLQTPGNSGKVNSIETLLENGQSLVGIDLSCARMVGSDDQSIQPSPPPIIAPTILENDYGLPSRERHISDCKPFTYLSRLDVAAIGTGGQHNLQEANLSDVNLSNANFANTDLQGAHFERSNLTNAIFRDVNIKGANFSDVDLSSTRLESVDIGEVDFSRTTMSDDTFDDIRITGDLHFADVSHFGSLDISRMDNEGRPNSAFVKLDFERAYINNFIASGIIIGDGNFTNFQRFHGDAISNFSGSTILGDFLIRAEGPEVDHTHGYTKFDHAMLENADFSGATLNGVVFRNTILRNANFSRATFNDTFFQNVDISGATFCDELGCAQGVN
ncbi:hypothetical protein GLP59_15185, partial [Sulfitobacter sp. M220]|uniref:pentapeptide repeat-containing protein n=1 Tax=Sulfitobacter sp. M220 TaxID=2675333 RepID=UPI001F2184F7